MGNPEKNVPLLTRTDMLLAGLIGIGALLLYIRTLAPSLLWGDSAEFQTLSYTLGMTHPSGYMTHIMIGKLFTYIPLGNIAYRVNLMSAVFGAVAVALVYAIVRLLGGMTLAGVSAAMLLGLSPLFWRNSVVAESYAPAAGMITTIWLLFLHWRKTRNWRYLFLAGLAGGLSVGIHSTIVMTAIPILVIMAFTPRVRGEWAGAAAGAALGLVMTLLFFFFLDYNNPPSSIYNTTYLPVFREAGLTANDFETTLRRFFIIFPAGHFWSYYFTAGSAETGRRLAEYVSLHPGWVVVFMLIGIFFLFKDNWPDALYPALSFLLIWGFAVTVAFSIYQEFYTPAAVFVAVWYGIGVSQALKLMHRLPVRREIASEIAQITLSLALIAASLWHSRTDLRLAIQSGYTAFVRRDHLYPIHAPHKAILDALKIIDQLEDNAIVFTDWDKLYSYVYTAHIEQRRTGMSFHMALTGEETRLSETTLSYIDQNLDRRPIYFAVSLPELADYFHVEQIDDSLYRIYRK